MNARFHILRFSRRNVLKKSGLCLCVACLPFTLKAQPGSVQIDRLVQARQLETGFPCSGRCSDEVFVRRVYLDLIGQPPSALEALEFIGDQSETKRAQLIDHLLNRPEFADYMALRWCDLLRVKSEFPGNLWPNAVQAYHRWIRDAFRSNMPYDRFVVQLLTASGSNFRDPPVNYFRPFQERTPHRFLETTVLLFMGMRLENSGWTEKELSGLTAFFAKVAFKPTREWKEEIVYSDPLRRLSDPETGNPVRPALPGKDPDEPDEFEDPRFAFAGWLTAPENSRFSENIVNRIWYWLLGRGIVHEPDDFRAGNPAWSPELLEFLSAELTASGYDLRHVFRLILNSDTYQASSVATPENAADVAGFSHYRLRRLDAEVLIDAVCKVTGSSEEYSSAIPEPFTFIPISARTVTLADGSIRSPFLEMFGRPGRDTSFVSERNNDISVFQEMHLLNSTHINRKIMTGGKLSALAKKPPQGLKPLEALYLEILSRYPTQAERKVMTDYIRESGLSRREAMQDICWALINSGEFLFRH